MRIVLLGTPGTDAVRRDCPPNSPRPAGRSRCDRLGSPTAGNVVLVASHASDVPDGPLVVVTNPEEDTSAEAFHRLLDELTSGPEPELETIAATEALRELRVDARA